MEKAGTCRQMYNSSCHTKEGLNNHRKDSSSNFNNLSRLITTTDMAIWFLEGPLVQTVMPVECLLGHLRQTHLRPIWNHAMMPFSQVTHNSHRWTMDQVLVITIQHQAISHNEDHKAHSTALPHSSQVSLITIYFHRCKELVINHLLDQVVISLVQTITNTVKDSVLWCNNIYKHYKKQNGY